MLVNLRTDPFENAEVCATLLYDMWRADRVFALAPAGALVAQYMQTMKDFPPRQSPESWSPGAIMEKLRCHQELLESGSGRATFLDRPKPGRAGLSAAVHSSGHRQRLVSPQPDASE